MATTTTTTESPLRLLANAISDAVDRIEGVYAAENLKFPSLDPSFDPTQKAYAYLTHPDIVQHVSVIVGAAEQLSVAVRPPQNVILEIAMAFHKSSCLGAVTAGHVTEILREGNDQGVHVNDIAAKIGMDSAKLARILRLLATHSIFTEKKPDVFANNRISSVLDTMKPASELLSGKEIDKYLGSNGVAALVEHLGLDSLRSSSFMTENLFDPETRFSDEPNNTPFNRAWGTKDKFFDWLYKPGNEQRAARFGVAMRGVEAPEAILGEGGFPWETLLKGSKIVDVGGGIGSVSLSIAKKFPGLKFVIQDLPRVLPQAEKFWKEQRPDDLKSGRVVVQKHNFFDHQPVKDADLFLLRVVIHDWPSSYAIKILQRLRDAAVVGKTKLLLADIVADYACAEVPTDMREIPGATRVPAPKSLLPNYGRANSMTYLVDIQMMTDVHGQERTIKDHIYVTEESKWKIIRVYRPAGSRLCHILAEPAV